MRVIRLFSLACLAFAAVLARAQSVHWTEGDGSIANSIVLAFENCVPDGQPDLPAIPGVTLTLLGQAENVSIVNLQMTRSVLLTYLVRSRQNAPVQIPAFSVKTDKGVLRVPAFNAGAPAAPLESVASARLVPAPARVWAGEVFGLNYELSASRRTNPQISPTFDWNAAPLVAEDWSRPEVTEAVVNGERRLNVVFRTRAIAKTPNTIKLEAANHLLSVQTGTIGFGIISSPRMEQVSVTSDQPTIEVRPLPAPPPGFSGAVGQFKLTSKIVPEKAAVGEPITWTLELAGTGNWPDIAGLPAREVSNDFRVVQPKAKRAAAEGKLFDVTLTEDVVLVPTRAGSYTLGPVAFTFFDPKTGSYVTRSTERKTIVVAAANAAAAGRKEAEKTDAGAADEPGAQIRKPPTTPAPPAGIPRDPLPGAAAVRAPSSFAAIAAWSLAPFGGVLLFWMWLAVRHARQTDPVRPRREARDRLARTLAQLGAATEADRAQLLLAWQHDTAVLWQLAHAAPRASTLPEAAWSTLWSEAERALYGPRPALPADWVARAQEALAAKAVPGFRPLRAFLPQNLMPFAAAFVLAGLAGATLLRAATPEAAAAYRKGDFAAAEKAWRERLAAEPTDWIARHNLSLALAQQERAGEAAAHASAAFVQHPGDRSVRWHLALAAEKAGSVPPALAAFLTPGPLHSLARLASPAQWQLWIVAASWAAALALAFMLRNAYGPRRHAANLGAFVVVLLGLGLAATASAGVAGYGLTARADAVVVARATTLRSIPTEADTTQKTSPLAAGSLAIAKKTFLGERWIQLEFTNGQTGWVRKEEIVGLWR